MARKGGGRHTIQKHDCDVRTQKMMVLVIVCGRGLVKCVKIPPNVKIDRAAYKKILKNIFNVWLPAIYSAEEMRKIYFHHCTHFAIDAEVSSVQAQVMGFDWIEKNDIPVKECKVSPLDFWGFGKVKHALSKRRPTTRE